MTTGIKKEITGKILIVLKYPTNKQKVAEIGFPLGKITLHK